MHGWRKCVGAPQRTATRRRVSGDSGRGPEEIPAACRRFGNAVNAALASVVAAGAPCAQPFLGCWALPGGDLRADRSLEKSAYHALETTTDLHPRYLEQLYTFGDPPGSMADCRWYPSCTGRSSARPRPGISPRTDNVRWFPEDELPELALTIARSSTTRCSPALEVVDTRRGHPKLVGHTLTLRQLHDVYEAITGEPIDVANFRPHPAVRASLKIPARKCAKAANDRLPCTGTTPNDPAVDGTPHEPDGTTSRNWRASASRTRCPR